MCQTFHCPPTSLWQFDPQTPKGFYFNRGVFYFGRKFENEMHEAEEQLRKSHKRGKGTDRLIAAARLSVLERNLGIAVKRHREPDQVANTMVETKENPNQDEVVFLKSESG